MRGRLAIQWLVALLPTENPCSVKVMKEKW